MKTNIILALLAIALIVLAVFGYKYFCPKCETDCSKCQTDCCKDIPYDMHISARILMQTYQDLVKKFGVDTCNAGGDVHFSQSFNVSGVMNASGFGYHPTLPLYSGVVTFMAFYYQDSTSFRTIWGGVPDDFATYRACVPDSIIFKRPRAGENHIYELWLIPVAAYQAATGTKDYKSVRGLAIGKTQDITAIENIRLEASTGYMKQNELALYNHAGSPRGFLCDVSIKGQTVKTPCYIIDNADNAAVFWKKENERQ